jgi:hypothetical protein
MVESIQDHDDGQKIYRVIHRVFIGCMFCFCSGVTMEQGSNANLVTFERTDLPPFLWAQKMRHKKCSF